MNLKQRLQATGLPRTAWVLAISSFFVAVGFGVLIPVLGPFTRTFGATSFQLGMVVSVFALMRLVTSPFAPAVGRLLGERNAIALGMVIVAASTVATAVSGDLWTMITMRGLGGIGSAMFTVAAMNLLLSTTPDHLRGRASGVYQGGFLLGAMAGPALGGVLSAISLTAPFYFYAVTLVVAAAVCVGLLPARAAPRQATTRPSPSFRAVLGDIRYQAACMVALGQGWQSFGVRNAHIPDFVTKALGNTTAATGMAFAVAAVAQTLALVPAGTWTDRIGRRPMMIASGLICGLATAAMPFSHSIGVLTLWLCLYGIGAAAQGTAPTAAVADVTEGRGGFPVAAFSMVTDAGSIAGPLVAGLLVDVAGYPAAFAVGAALLALGSLYAAFIPRKLDQQFKRVP